MEDAVNNGPVLTRRDSPEASSSLLRDEGFGSLDNVTRDPSHSGTSISGILNLSQTILGAGILAMPSAVANVGVVFGSVLILVSAGAAAFGLYLLSLLAQNSRRNASFFSCSKMTWPNLAMFFDLAIAIKCFGVSVSYLVICRDLLPQVVLGFFPSTRVGSSLFTSRIFWVSICMWIISPLAFARKLSSLKYVSAFALSFVFFLTFMVTYFYSVAPSSTRPPEIRLIHVDSQFFLYLPIFVFAFTCHQNVSLKVNNAKIFSIHNEIKDNSFRNMKKIIGVSISISAIVYLIIGNIGYLTFGNLINSNIISMYPTSIIVTCGQLAIAMLVLFSYPLQCHPCRNSIHKIILGSGNSKNYHV